jgi:hypothetical protein
MLRMKLWAFEDVIDDAVVVEDVEDRIGAL